MAWLAVTVSTFPLSNETEIEENQEEDGMNTYFAACKQRDCNRDTLGFPWSPKSRTIRKIVRLYWSFS
jgi:hypothetical protein